MKDKHLEALAQDTGLGFDEATGAVFGFTGGYHVCLVPSAGNRSVFTIQFSAMRGGVPPTKEELKALTKSCRQISNSQIQQNGLVVTAKPNGWSRKKSVDNARLAMEETIAFLRQNGYYDCCQQCAQQEPTQTYLVNGRYMHLCPACYASISAQASQHQLEEEQTAENVVGGLVGAFLGSLLGVLVMVVLDQLGYVAAISGIVLAVCTLKGYEMLGGKLTKKGTVISILVMIVMVYFGNRVAWAITFYSELKEYLDMSVFEYFRYLPELLELSEAQSQYIGSLVMQYLFAALGAVPSIISAGKNKQLKNTARPLGRSE